MGRPLSVLICEPVSAVADSLRSLFLDDSVDVVKTGRESQLRLESSPPDFLLLDMFAEDSDAFDFLSRIHLLGLAPTTRIIVLSPTNPDSLFEKLYGFGITAVIRRTDESAELLAELRPYLPVDWNSPKSHRGTVLFVGGRRAYSKLAEVAASNFEFEFYSAPTPSSAKRLLDSIRPTALVVDLDDGLGQLGLLIHKAREMNPAVRVVTLANSEMTELQSQLSDLRIDHYLLKPCSSDDLSKALFPAEGSMGFVKPSKISSVLIVEDSAETAETMQSWLNQNGWSGTVAGSAERALELLPQHDFSAMLLDLGLPGMDGVELLARVRHSGMKIPCVVITASRNKEDLKLLADLGIEGLFEKPADFSSVVQRISQATTT